ncbi:MAG: ROK family protein [Candidatus Omnitrophica bacterium]|nr:ROK family protein [Candidatus Omnitrophota bacterium]
MKKKTQFTANPSTDHEKKNLLFLNLIKSRKSTSRTEISKLTEINVVTVSNYVNSYLKKGLVLEHGYDISSGGRRPELIELNKEWGYTLGIDVSASCVKGVILDLGMQVLASDSTEGCGKKDLKLLINEIVQKLLNASKIDKIRIKKIGISADSKDIKEEIIKIKSDLEEEMGILILTANGAVCAAFGERALNPDARDSLSVLYVYKDTGEMVYIKDEGFYEADEEKSEYAYLRPWGRELSIIGEVKNIIKKGVGTKIIDMTKGGAGSITLETVIKAAKEKDEVAGDIIKMAGTNLGVRTAYLINSFKPEAVIIGGGVEQSGDIFLKALKTSVNRFILHDVSDKVRLASAVLGKDACSKGAAFLAIREAFIES